ncbi:MAG: GT4 family glycosyltransferase PelF [Agathobacter sp.]
MRICMIVEGAYPYVTGGVSSWVHQAITSMPQHEFVIVTLVASRNEKRKIKYKLPDNVVELHEFYLQDEDYGNRNRREKMSKKEYNAFKSLFFGSDVDWETIFKYFKNRDVSIDSLLMSEDFLRMVREYYESHFDRLVFSDFLWTLRSTYFPLFSVLTSKIPKADLYHCLSTGYAGVIGSMAKYLYHKPLLISEHGIYTREREEEIIKADWVTGEYKDLWIQQFRKFSDCAYYYADKVTSLYEGNRDLQIEFGCPKEKLVIIPNGVDAKVFENIPKKDAEDEYTNIGAILRVAPIKDVKTMLSAFSIAKSKNNRLKLWIMGPLDEMPEYVQECLDMVKYMHIEDVVFTGAVNVMEYIGKMDFLVLTSISEGQPLVILEGFAAHKPFIATNVGDCKGLIHGNRDNLGDAGIVVPVMNTAKVADAMLYLAEREDLCKQMGEVGYQRSLLYDKNECYSSYRDMYEKLGGVL